jgi:hypothetical protein
MPTAEAPATKRDSLVGARVAPLLLTHLDELAHQARRTRADILRFLIAKATRDDLPAAWFAAAPAEDLLRGNGRRAEPADRAGA